jgi:hypothetical protein
MDPVRDNAFGSPDSWLLDGALAGALIPAASFLGALLTAAWLDRQPLDKLLLHGGTVCVLGLLVYGGGFVGVLLGPLAGLLVRWLWRVPLLVWGLGAALGAGCAWLGTLWLDLAVPSRGLLAGWGALALGAPWVAYVAVRGRGRSGTPVVMVSVGWAVLTASLTVVAHWLRWRYGA